MGKKKTQKPPPPPPPKARKVKGDVDLPRPKLQHNKTLKK